MINNTYSVRNLIAAKRTRHVCSDYVSLSKPDTNYSFPYQAHGVNFQSYSFIVQKSQCFVSTFSLFIFRCLKVQFLTVIMNQSRRRKLIGIRIYSNLAFVLLILSKKYSAILEKPNTDTKFTNYCIQGMLMSQK